MRRFFLRYILRSFLRKGFFEMVRLLLLGFRPFGGDEINPSQLLLESLVKRAPLPSSLASAILPVDHAEVMRDLPFLLEKHDPQMILGLGVAEGESGLRLEAVGVNWADFGIPDQAGNQLRGQPILPHTPDAYLTELPLRAWRDALLEAAIPASLSYTAGTYLCNQLFYLCLHDLHKKGRKRYAGFLHLPLLPAMVVRRLRQERGAAKPSMSLATMQDALAVILREAFSFLDSRG
jgi:pyroglutamyl-peptidase